MTLWRLELLIDGVWHVNYYRADSYAALAADMADLGWREDEWTARRTEW